MKILSKLWRSLGYSLAGLVHVLRHDLSFQLDVAFLVGAWSVAWIKGLGASQLGVLLGLSILLLVAELLNHAIETLADVVAKKTMAPPFKIAKDAGSAAVFLCLVAIVVFLAL